MRVFFVLLLLLTVVPFLELTLLLQIHTLLGFFPTLLLVLLTGALGAALARRQGLRVLAQLRRELDAGQLPANALFEGVLILVAGVLLVTPGVLTDALGFLLLAPPFRVGIGALAHRWAKKRSLGVRGAAPQVFEAEVIEVDPAPPTKTKRV